MVLNFNKDWYFCRDGENPEPITLPHDAMITERRTASCRNGVNSGYFIGGKYTYKKKFIADEGFMDKSVELHFGGVYQNCTVLLNGEIVGTHKYGYTSFIVDISDAVKIGENSLTVKVDNSLEPNCRWYSGSGIYRDIELVIRNKNHIENVIINTVSITPAKINVKVISLNTAIVRIYDNDTLITEGAAGDFEIKNARFWTAETPYLYTCVVKTDTDERKIKFGIRKLEWSAEKGLTVNGKRVLLRGGCIHHDHGVLGACEYYDAEKRRISILKKSGFNAVRVAHNPASEKLLDICDELGMYVMNESFDGWFTPKTYHDYSRFFYDEWKNDLRCMVESSRNHPSVIMYSVGNEVSETAFDKGADACEKITKFVKRIDDTRPITAGINVLLNVYAKLGIGVYKDKGAYKPEPLPEKKGFKEKKKGSAFFNAMTSKLGKLMFFMSSGKSGSNAIKGADSLDIIGFNYASSQYDYQAKHNPKRMMVGSETFAVDLPYNWDRIKKYPQLIGDFVWSAWDYLGEACIGDWTYHSYKGLPLLAGQGMIDITGKPLASMYFMQIVWGLRNKPFIAVSPLNHYNEIPSTGSWQFTNAVDSWSWHGYENKKAKVEVYSDSSFVRLKLNDNEIAVKPVEKFRSVFTVPYQKGTLTAEALDENKCIISSFSLKSADDKTVLSVMPEKDKINENGLCYVPIEFSDNNGNLKPYIEQRVDIEVTGAGRLIGFGSALCKTDEIFDKSYHNSYRGRCLAVIKADETAGTITITVQSENVNSVSAQIEVI